MRELVSTSNVYIEERQKSTESSPSLFLLENIVLYITRILKIFGAIEDEKQIGFPVKGTGDATKNVEEVVMPYLSVLAKFREEAREVARRKKDVEMLELCDKLRDDVLPDLGIQLEDHDGVPPSIKIVGREKLIKEKEAKREAKLKQEELDRQKAAEKARENELKEEAKKIPPTEMFRKDERYSKFDEKGLPTHDASGQELSKSQIKKLSKLYEAQAKKYDDYLKTRQNVST